MRQSVVVAASLTLGVFVVCACGPRAQSPATVSVSPPVEASRVAPTVSPAGAVAYLAGRASIGPLQPVERVGMPSPTPPAAACTSRGLVIYSATTGVENQRISFEPDCTYRTTLPPGEYRVELDAHGIDRSKDLPRTVTIAAGQTTQVDLSIDTGLR